MEFYIAPDDDIEGDSTIYCMLTWYKLNSVIGPFYLRYNITRK